MRDAFKVAVKDAISDQFHQLSKGQYITHAGLIFGRPIIMEAFYRYEYTSHNPKTIPYLRRLCKEVTSNSKYGCQHIIPFRHPVPIGKGWKKKKQWVWGWPDDSQGKTAMQEYDAKSAGIVHAQKDKAPHIEQPVVTVQTEAELKEELQREVEEEVEDKETKKEAEAVKATLRGDWKS